MSLALDRELAFLSLLLKYKKILRTKLISHPTADALTMSFKFISRGEPVRFSYPKQNVQIHMRMPPSSRERGRTDASSCLGFRGSRLMEAKQKVSGCLGLATRGALSSRVLRAQLPIIRHLGNFWAETWLSRSCHA
jgi:hypothetical protein